MSAIIGIDLGTSTTEAAIYRNGKVEMILNYEGDEITPSAIGIDENGEWVVGQRAMSQFLLSPENTAIEVKRKIGTDELVSIGGKKYSPIALSAKLLGYVRDYAEEYLGEDINEAVISVPAYFNDTQRQQTIQAGVQAGFKVRRILNEPTAAALSYGLDHMEEESRILVYDLGGGTFDVTLLEMFDGVLEVKASSGDNQLGGKDFDEKIINHLQKAFEKKYGVSLASNKHAMVALKEEAEKCKKALSKEERYQVLIPAITTVAGQPVELDETLTRKEFEKMVAPLIERTHHPIDVVLSDAGIAAGSLDKIILVGGSTRMPIVARDIASYLGKEPDVAVNPDFAVSEGAAIQAGIISGEIDAADGLIMTDVNAYSLGISCIMDGFYDGFSVIIPRNSTIPTTGRETYCTASDMQTAVDVRVYQGENKIASQNHLLGNFRLTGFPPRPAGEEKLDVEFSYNLNGTLEVHAFINSTGKEASISIDMQKAAESDDVIIEDDSDAWRDSPIANNYRAIIRKADRAIARLNDEGGADVEHINRLSAAVRSLKEAIASEDVELADEIENTVVGMLHFLEDE